MKKYCKYNLQDLLLDDDFKLCVLEYEKGNTFLWDELLRQNPDHTCLFAQALEILLSLGQNVSSLTEEELHDGVEAIMLHTNQNRQTFNRGNIFRWISIAASVVLILGVIFIKPKLSEPILAYSEIIVNVTMPLKEVVNDTEVDKRIILPDSSIVVLAPTSKISYTNPFVLNNRREIYLSGNAFFVIEKDTLNPLYVYTKGLVTRVVGTSFLIKTTKDEVKVMVRTGRVAVKPINRQEKSNQESKELFLIPNQQASFSTKDNEILKKVVELPKELKRDQKMTFENKPISEVFDVLEKVYGIPFNYDHEITAKCLLRVEFSDESLFEKLDIITQTIGGSYQVMDGQVHISSNGCN